MNIYSYLFIYVFLLIYPTQLEESLQKVKHANDTKDQIAQTGGRTDEIKKESNTPSKFFTTISEICENGNESNS